MLNEIIAIIARNVWIVFVISMLLVILAVVVRRSIWRKYDQYSDWYTQAIQKIKNACPAGSLFTREEFDKLDAELSQVDDTERPGSKNLRFRWNVFTETVHDNKYGSEGIYNSRKPDDIFKADDSSLKPKFFGLNYSAIPAYFVTIGLIFTFISLSAVLYYTSDELGKLNRDGENSTFKFDLGGQTLSIKDRDKYQDDVKDIMVTALKLASIKFVVSIFGLFASLIVSVAYRRAESRLSGKIGEFNQELERRLYFARPRDQEQLALSLRMCEGIDRLADVLAEKLRTSIAEGFKEAKIAMELLAQAVRQLQEEIQQITGGLSDFNAELENTTESMREALAKTGASIVSQLKDIMSELERTVSRLIGEMDKTSRVFSANVAASQGALATATKEFIDSSKEYSGEHAKNLKEYTENLIRHFTALQTAIAEMEKKIIDSGKSHAEELDKLLQHVLDSYRNSIGQIQQSVADDYKLLRTDMKKLCDELKMLAEAISNAGEDSSREIKSAQTGLNEATDKVVRAISVITEKATVFEGVYDTMELLPDKLIKIVEAAADKSANKSMEVIKDEISSTASSHAKLREEITKTTTEIMKLAKSLNDVLEEFKSNTKKAKKFGWR